MYSHPYEGDIVADAKGGIMSAKRNYRTESIGLQSIMGIVLENDGSFNINYESNRFCLSVVLYNGGKADDSHKKAQNITKIQ